MNIIKALNLYLKTNRFIFIGICLFLCFSLYAQNEKNEQVKRLQRAIFVYNFAQQVTWENQDDYSRFKIGVLGPDRAIIDFKSLGLKRKINNKPVDVVRFNSVKNVKEIQLLYVNNIYNFDINYILNKISGKHILLITEDYNYNTSMVNMVSVGDSFEYEINMDIIHKEGFVALNSLKQYAISSSQKWKSLYKTTEVSLYKSKKTEAKQQEVINKKEEEILSQKEKIDNQEIVIDTILNTVSTKNKWIETLSYTSELQQQKFEDKEKIERELEENIKQQIEFIKSQKEKIDSSDIEIKKQFELIKNQTSEIKKKEVILEKKESTINAHKNVNILLIALVSLALLGSFFIYRSFLAKKKLSKTLEIKNKAIQNQTLELKSKNDELEQFAYIASHDLKEPLITISSLIGLLIEDYYNKFDEDGKTSLNYINDSSVRMQKLIDAILQYSRLGKSKKIVNINCNNVIDILKEDLQNVIKRTKSTIKTNKLPIIQGAELEIRLLFQNLISNGIKFVKAGVNPIIEIDCNKKTDIDYNEFWEFSIKDNGIGIPEKHKERIFSIFQRLHSREKYEGTGIGLAHCKKIVEAHGGTIWLDSKEGKGSIFYFSIPA